MFVGLKKSRTFASRLLSKVYKSLILRMLIILCPVVRSVRKKKLFFSSNILKKI